MNTDGNSHTPAITHNIILAIGYIGNNVGISKHKSTTIKKYKKLRGTQFP